MIKGIGIDIIDKQRMEKLIDRLGERFLLRILTPLEYQAIPSGERAVEYASGRFAAKEAFAKAVGTGIGKELSWQDIEVGRDERGKPILILSSRWLGDNDPDRRLKFHVSITHEKKYAVAQVIIEE